MKKVLLVIASLVLSYATLDASRIKKDLTKDYLKQINTLFDENMKILDTLNKEATVFSSQKDKLIQKNYYNFPIGFMATTENFTTVVSGSNTLFTRGNGKIFQTYKPKNPQNIFLEHHKDRANYYVDKGRDNTRDILGVSTSKKKSYYTEAMMFINFFPRVAFGLERGYRDIFVNFKYGKIPDPRDEIPKMINLALDNPTGDKLADKMLTIIKKYQLFARTLSQQDSRSLKFEDMKRAKYMSGFETFTLEGSMTTFFSSFTSKQGKEQQLYHDTKQLSKNLEKLIKEKRVKKTTLPNYYTKELQRDDMLCIESLQDIKYKSRICINQPLDAEDGKLFKIGYFEPSDYNFIQTNKEKLMQLAENSKDIERLLLEYVKVTYLKSKNSQSMQKQQKSEELHLEHGL